MKTKIMFVAVIAVFLVSLGFWWYTMHRTTGDVVEIIQNGTVLYTLDLSTTENQMLRIVSWDDSSYNLVSIVDGTICISEAGCPDHTCVQTGVLHSSAQPIVCLPNRLVIRYVEGAINADA